MANIRARQPYARRPAPLGPLKPFLDTELANVQRAVPVPITRAVVADASVVASDDLILADATGGPITVTLPPADRFQFLKVTIKRVGDGDNIVTVSGDMGTIASFELRAPGQSLTVQSDGVVWQLVRQDLDPGSYVIPQDGRTDTTLTEYLANNANFNILDYYLSADGVTMDAAIARAVAALTAAGNGTLVIPPGEHSCASRVDINLPHGATIQWEGQIVSTVSADAAVRIGSTTETKFWYRMIGGIDIRRATLDPSGSSIGLEFRNVGHSRFVISRVYGFTTGMRCYCDFFNGFSYNHFHIHYLTDSTINLRLTASGAGFVNENAFYGGSFGHSSTYLATAPAVATVNLKIDGPDGNPLNNNRFYSPSFEDNSLIAKAAEIGGQFILIVHPRMENTVLAEDYLLHFTSDSLECEVLGLGAGVNASNILDEGNANSYRTRDGLTLRSFTATADEPVMQSQAVATGAARVFQGLDSGGTARFWVTGDGAVHANQEGFFNTGIRWLTTTRGIFVGSGSPEGAVTADPGSLYVNAGGGTGTTLYAKETGVGTNTGWVAK